MGLEHSVVAEDFLQRFHEMPDAGIIDAVVNEAALAARAHEPLGPHQREHLGNGRLGSSTPLDQISHGAFALREPAEDLHSKRMGHELEEFRDALGFTTELKGFTRGIHRYEYMNI